MRFVLTVDTEADDQWSHGVGLTTDNVSYWEPFQSLCATYEISPTYLVTSEIVADPLARELLGSWAAKGRAEIGAHLHPWTTPPFRDEPGYRYNDPAHAFLSELADDLIREKLRHLTDEIVAAFGVRPTSFRAGRFGFDGRCAEMLAELGYHVDSSVVPMTRPRSHPGLPAGPGGPDFREFDARPFIVKGTGDPGLLEIPVTILPTYSLLHRSRALLDAYCSWPLRGIRRAALSRWLSPQPVWLQPLPNFRDKDLQAAFSLQSEQTNVALMILHSSELMPGGSPFRRDESAVRDLLGVLDRFLAFVRNTGAISATLSEAALGLKSSGGLDVLPV